jgi:hypothetical protein
MFSIMKGALGGAGSKSCPAGLLQTESGAQRQTVPRFIHAPSLQRKVLPD